MNSNAPAVNQMRKAIKENKKTRSGRQSTLNMNVFSLSLPEMGQVPVEL